MNKIPENPEIVEVSENDSFNPKLLKFREKVKWKEFSDTKMSENFVYPVSLSSFAGNSGKCCSIHH